jgi:quercetin dioxygenase-like cupin family protein
MPFIELGDFSEHEPIPGYRVRFVHSASMTFAYWAIAAGAELPEHSHPHEQVAHVLEGEFELVIAGERQRLRAGMVAIIPSNATHSGRAVSNCRLLDAFHPVREDYVAKWR